MVLSFTDTTPNGSSASPWISATKPAQICTSPSSVHRQHPILLALGLSPLHTLAMSSLPVSHHQPTAMILFLKQKMASAELSQVPASSRQNQPLHRSLSRSLFKLLQLRPPNLLQRLPSPSLPHPTSQCLHPLLTDLQEKPVQILHQWQQGRSNMKPCLSQVPMHQQALHHNSKPSASRVYPAKQ